MVAAVGVVGAAFLRVVIHFVYKVSETGPPHARVVHRKCDWLSENPLLLQNGLIAECEQVAQGEGVTFVSSPYCSQRPSDKILNPMQRFGIWGPRVSDRLTPAEAQTCKFMCTSISPHLVVDLTASASPHAVCNNAWNRDSLDEILFLIFEISTHLPRLPSPTHPLMHNCISRIISHRDILHRDCLRVLPPSPRPHLCRQRLPHAREPLPRRPHGWPVPGPLQPALRRRGGRVQRPALAAAAER